MGQLPYEPVEPQATGERSWLVPVAIIGLTLLLLVSLTGGALLVLGQQREVRALERDLARARAELADTREELAQAREDVEDGTDDAPGDAPGDGLGGLGGLLDGLLEGLGEGGGLGEGLGGLLDGLGEGLGGATGVDPGLLSCLTQAMQGGEVRPIEGDVETQVAAIAERVEEIRGLSFDGEIDAEFLDPEAFAAEVRRSFDEDYDEAVALDDQRVLVALGAIPADMDLRARYLDLISGQAAGFYRPETGEIVVRAQPGASLDATAQITLAHELEHALTDERLGLPDRDAETDADAARAGLALVEGSASLAMQQFAARSLGMAAQLQLGLDPSIAEQQAQLDAFPHYLARELVFPYETGLGFACSVHADGGWPAVDAAYDAIPTTSAQILWPERWRDGEGAATPDGGTATPAGWSEARTTTLGAADLLWLFEAPGDDLTAALDDPAARAQAWGGGTLRLLERGADHAVAVALVQRDGATDLCDSVEAWYRAAHPDGEAAAGSGDERLVVEGGAQDAVLRCTGDEVLLGIGPDVDTARALTG